LIPESRKECDNYFMVNTTNGVHNHCVYPPARACWWSNGFSMSRRARTVRLRVTPTPTTTRSPLSRSTNRGSPRSCFGHFVPATRRGVLAWTSDTVWKTYTLDADGHPRGEPQVSRLNGGKSGTCSWMKSPARCTWRARKHRKQNEARCAFPYQSVGR
jgi:hypothetical protein